MSATLTKHKPGGTGKAARVAPPAPRHSAASDAALAAALYKVFPDADKLQLIDSALDESFRKHLAGSPVVHLARAVELGYVVAHTWQLTRATYYRPAFSFMPARLVGSVADRSPLLRNAEHIAQAAARLGKIVDKLADAGQTREKLRVAVPPSPAEALQIVEFRRTPSGKYLFHRLEL